MCYNTNKYYQRGFQDEKENKLSNLTFNAYPYGWVYRSRGYIRYR